MLRILRTNEPAFAQAIEQLIRRAADEQAIEPRVREILEQVREKGDEAVLNYTRRFDGVSLTASQLKVTDDEIKAATQRIDSAAKDTIRRAKERIEAFHQNEIQRSWLIEQEDGTLLGQLVRPLASVGIYVPGGSAPYPSSVLMNAVPAGLAGVPRQILVTPPGKDGRVNQYVLCAANMCGLTEIYKIGGAQAIAALAWGTATVPRVEKIVGPGNAYVNVAKRLVFGKVGIDALAGPSEIVILAEEGANPAFIAADLLSQAEHDPLATAILITPAQALADTVGMEVTRQIRGLSRANVITAALRERGAIIVVDSLDEGIDLVNRIAPEHLEVLVKDPFDILPRVRNAGMILLGVNAPVPLCDYGAGPNHVLPTGGAARYASPLGVMDFVKRTNVMAPGKDALSVLADQVETLARIEGFTAHAAAIMVRRRPTDV